MTPSTAAGPDGFTDSGDAFADDGVLGGLGFPEVLFFGFVVTFIVVVFVLVIVMIVKNWRHMRAHDLDPMTAQAQLFVAATRSRALAPELTLEERLENLEELHRTGRITDEERSAARAKLLGGD